MKPVRMTLAEVDAATGPVPLHEWDAAMEWWCLRELLGDAAPDPLPEHPHASESARCVWSLLADEVGDVRMVPDPIGVLMTRAEMPDPLVVPEAQPGAWRVLAEAWFGDALEELVVRKMAVRLGDGSVLLREVPS